MIGHKQQDYFRHGWSWLLIVLVISWCWTELAIAQEGRKYALVVGISDYNNASGLGRLKYARADAEALTQALRRAGYKVQLVVDHGVVKNFLVKTLRQLASFLRPDDTFVFAYSGHGFEGADGRDYLALYGVTSETVSSEGLPVDEVLDLLRKTRTSQLLVLLDACRDGMDLQNRTTLVKSATFSRQWFSKNTRGIKVLFATQPGGVSWEDDKLQHGVFTHFLLRGLEGKAKDGTGAITFNSLASYVDRAISDWGWENNKLQTPYSVNSDNVPLVLVSNNMEVEAGTKVVSVSDGDTIANAVQFDNFGNSNNLILDGKAAIVQTYDGSVLRLTPAIGGAAGSAFISTPTPYTGFSTAFRFRISQPGNDGADGLVFVIHADKHTVGGAGGYMGYSGIHSLGIEWDTWYNPEFDPDSNHIGINIAGSVAHAANQHYIDHITPDFSNGQVWYGWIDYNGHTLEVRTNQTGIRPNAANITRDMDLRNLLGGATQIYVGFTAGTGGAWENHDILSWSYKGLAH